MFRSTYIPVKCEDGDGVYFSTKYFDGARLRQAVQLLKYDTEQVEGVKQSAGNIYFDDDPELVWPIFEVFLAYKALHIAEENDFWYTAILDENNIPQLYVSIVFNNKCILVNALTDHSLVLKNKAYITTVQNLANEENTYVHLQRLFFMLEALEKGTAKVLSAVRVSTPEGDQYMVTNPYTFPYHKDIASYGVDTLTEIESLLTGQTRKTESFDIIASGIRRIDSTKWPTIPRDTAQMLIDTFHTIVGNKSNYLAIYDSNFEDYLYWSLNQRYLVRADTLECVVVTNKQVKKLLTVVADGGANDSSHLDLIWRLACQL